MYYLDYIIRFYSSVYYLVSLKTFFFTEFNLIFFVYFSNARHISNEVPTPYQPPPPTSFMQPTPVVPSSNPMMGNPQQPNIFTPDYSQNYGQVAPSTPNFPSMVAPPPKSGKYNYDKANIFPRNQRLDMNLMINLTLQYSDGITQAQESSLNS